MSTYIWASSPTEVRVTKFSKPGSSPMESAAHEYRPEGAPEPLSAGKQELLDLDGVEGVGEGRDFAGRETITVYVRDQEVLESLPAELEGKSIMPMVTGVIRAE